MTDSANLNSSCLRSPLGRRTVLRGSGVAMSLPWLSAMRRAVAAPSTSAERPKRFVSTTLGLGLVGENLNPTKAGRHFEAPAYLKAVEDMRDHYTVISGTSHPGVKGGHRAEASILTGQPMGTSGQVRNSISLDQLMARHVQGKTRFDSLVLATSGSSSPCYTENGAMITPQTSPSSLFNSLFVDVSQKERNRNAKQVVESRSIMDLVAEDAKSLQRDLGVGDRDRLDAYFTSVRELERRMKINEAWARRPKPKVDVEPPVDAGDPNDLILRFELMCDVIRLALETDSARVISLHLPAGGGVLPLEGVDQGYHSLSHHGRDEEKLSQLQIVETAIVKQWGRLLSQLHQCEDGESTLLDQTSVFLTSNLGNASNHDNRNMPVLVGGGSFQHGNHLAFDQKNNYPLTNLYVSFLQHMGIETDQFSSGTGTLRGLEFRS